MLYAFELLNYGSDELYEVVEYKMQQLTEE